jgi:uncharacterized protein (DUF433 family)
VAGEVGGAFAGIESTSGVCGGEPCIVRTRIPVRVLEQYRRLGMSEAALLENSPTLRAQDLANAWAYVQAHRPEMDELIRATRSIERCACYANENFPLAVVRELRRLGHRGLKAGERCSDWSGRTRLVLPSRARVRGRESRCQARR